MKGLFVKDFIIKLAQATPVSQDAAQWPKQALNEFLAEFPEFTNEDLQVQMHRKDPEKGYAIGAITFRKGTIAVPIIIKEFAMSSFDVIVAMNKVMPLTRENLFTLFSNKQAYGTLAPIDTAGNFVSMFDPALRAASGEYSMNQYSVKAAESVDYSFIDHLSDSTTAKVKNAILKLVNDDLELKVAFERNKTTEILDKIASLRENDKIDVKSTLSHALDRDIHYIYKTGANEYTGIFGSSQAYDPVVMKLTQNDIKDFDSLKLVKIACEKGCKCPKCSKKMPEKKKVAVFSILNDKINKLVIREDHKYAEIAPFEKLGDAYEEYKLELEGKMPEVGKKYVLKLGDNEVTRPWDVIRTTFLEGTHKFAVDVFDGLEKRSYYITKGIKGIYPHETEKKAYYISDSIDWV